MSKKTSQPGKIHLRIIEVMKRFPDGITAGQIRQELEREGLRPEDQTHLDRRKRDLKKWFVIEKGNAEQIVEGKRRSVVVYKYRGERQRITDEGQINQKLRAEVIHAAHGRCQMCGKTIEKHGISLVVDHKKPRDWGFRTGLSDSTIPNRLAAVLHLLGCFFQRVQFLVLIIHVGAQFQTS